MYIGVCGVTVLRIHPFGANTLTHRGTAVAWRPLCLVTKGNGN